MFTNKLQITPAVTTRITFSASFAERIEMIQLDAQAVRKELIKLFSFNNFAFYSAEKLLNTLMASHTEGIRSDLYYQLNTCRKQYDPEVCAYIIESLDEHGFFAWEKEKPFPFDENKVRKNLDLIQSFEPLGIALQNSTEYISLQLKNKNKTAYAIFNECQQEIIDGKLDLIKDKYQLNNEELDSIFQIIRHCSLYPCIQQEGKTQWIEPDVLLSIENNELIISPAFFDVPEIPSCVKLSPELEQYLKRTNLKLDLINQRNLTLLQIFHALIEIQRDYFLLETPLKPCRLEDISNLTGIHISTISRCVKNKYYQYQDQIYPFNTLMPSGNVQGKSHDEIYQILSSILKTEDKDNPYQDQILIEMLEKEGVKLSRRGLANLRKKWNIPNSYQRKQRY